MLSADSLKAPVITFRHGYRTKAAGEACHLCAVSIARMIREAFGIIIRGRPYVLRSYFDTQLLAESQDRILLRRSTGAPAGVPHHPNE